MSSDRERASDGARAGTAGAGPALFRLVRFWGRRWPSHATGGPTSDEQRVQIILVLDAIDTAARGGAEVSVGDVAYQLGIDRSGASRLVTDAAAQGYLIRVASAGDARRAVLTVTARGLELLTGAQAWQEEVYAELTARWEPSDAATLARHLRRLAAEIGESDAGLR